GVPFAIAPLANGDDNQHTANENLRVGHYVAGVKSIPDLLLEPFERPARTFFGSSRPRGPRAHGTRQLARDGRRRASLCSCATRTQCRPSPYPAGCRPPLDR